MRNNKWKPSQSLKVVYRLEFLPGQCSAGKENRKLFILLSIKITLTFQWNNRERALTEKKIRKIQTVDIFMSKVQPH